MQDSIINILLGFVEGLGLIVSPCILPILPIILSGSIDGSKKRPFGIICGFVLIFALFTFFSRKLVQVSGIDLNTVRHIAFGVLFLLGLTMISNTLTEKFSRLTQRIGNIGSQSKLLNNSQGGFASGILFGALVALIWTPCAGPILAAVIVQTVIQKSTLLSFFILMAFALGSIIPMLIIAMFGRVILNKLSFVKRHLGVLRKILGFIIMLSVLWMAYGDVYSAPTFSTDSKDNSVHQMALISGLDKPYPAPALEGIVEWINSPPLTIADLKGKVVLIDFWTYSCINCKRSLPYINSWYEKYHDQGLVIIGVHSPEFEFEKDVNNIKAAVEKYGIKYPVAVDSNYGTWLNYHNKYWPAHYLIDKTGNVVYEHFGEGEYDTTENNIRFLLGLNKITNDSPASENLGDLINHETPETYLGTARARSFASLEPLEVNKVKGYTFPQILLSNDWALQGMWRVIGENAISADKDAAVKIHFHAQKVYVVMGTQKNTSLPVKILLNGEQVVLHKGSDVNDSTISVDKHALYEALSFASPQDGILELIAPAEGLEIYTFTFGSK